MLAPVSLECQRGCAFDPCLSGRKGSGLDPAIAVRNREKATHVGFKSRDVKGLLEVADNLRPGSHAVTEFEDFAGASVELNHALRVQKHPCVLYWLPLQ